MASLLILENLNQYGNILHTDWHFLYLNSWSSKTLPLKLEWAIFLTGTNPNSTTLLQSPRSFLVQKALACALLLGSPGNRVVTKSHLLSRFWIRFSSRVALAIERCLSCLNKNIFLSSFSPSGIPIQFLQQVPVWKLHTLTMDRELSTNREQIKRSANCGIQSSFYRQDESQNQTEIRYCARLVFISGQNEVPFGFDNRNDPK